MFGDLRIAPKGIRLWQELQVHESFYGDWTDEFRRPDPERPIEVSSALAEIRAFPTVAEDCWPGRIEVKTERSLVSVRGFLLEEGHWIFATQVASIFRAAARAGANGHLHFLHVRGEFARSIEIGDGTSRFRTIDDRKVIQRLRASGGAVEAQRMWAATLRADGTPTARAKRRRARRPR